jgi:dihydrolipoamide dehydrogenase
MQDIKEKYDLVVVGAGPGGTPVAIEYAKLNHEKSVALIDATGELGGECLFQGCIPSKILEASAKHIKDLKSLEEFGVEIKDAHYQLIWDKVKQRKDKILNQRTKAAKKVAKGVGNIDIIQGMASFESENSIKIIHENKQTTIVQFEKALIATGSKSITPVYKGDAAKEVMTNNKFFHDMELPNRLSIVGGGAIAVEFAQILSTFGVNPLAISVRHPKMVLGRDIPLFSGFSTPFHGLGIVFWNPATFSVHPSKSVLGNGISLFSSFSPPLRGITSARKSGKRH